MAWLTTGLRRSILLVLVLAAGGALWSWRRDQSDASALGPAEWPPLTSPPAPAKSADDSVASFVNSLVDAPEARSTDRSSGGWTDPLADGSCPVEHPVKANDNSGIFHLPDGRFYDRTNAERCYSDVAAAAADGYRQAKN